MDLGTTLNVYIIAPHAPRTTLLSVKTAHFSVSVNPQGSMGNHTACNVLTDALSSHYNGLDTQKQTISHLYCDLFEGRVKGLDALYYRVLGMAPPTP